MQYKLLLWTIAATVIVSGCDNNESLVASQSENVLAGEADMATASAEVVAYVAMKQAEGGVLDGDEVLVALAQDIPGFGGLYVNERSELVVRIKDHKRFTADHIRNTLRVKIKDVSGLSRASDRATRLSEAKYTFPELYAWKLKARQVFDVPGVVSLDANEVDNIIEVGVENAAASMQVRSALAELGIPIDAIAVVVTGGTMPTQFTTTELNETFRPVEGGFQILNSLLESCTIGFSAYRYGQLGFVTNSHCSHIDWAVDGGTINQAQSDGIGYETVDPAFQSYGASKVAGPPSDGRLHRKSDAAFYQSTTTNVNVARIARTRGRGTHTGSRIRESAFTITAEAPSYHPVGTELNKVGRTTGWTYGNITRSCVEERRGKNASGIDRVLDCQYWVAAGVDKGDSGSPVFSQNPPQGTTLYPITLYGILWGCKLVPGTGNCDTVNPEFVYSPISGVEADLGALTTY